MRSFFAELRRRNVLRAGAFYAASAWLLVQVATQVFPFFHVSEWIVRWIVVAAIIAFPFALAFAWFYEITPGGLKRESEVEPDASITRQTGRTLDRWIIAVLAVAVALLLANTFVLHKDPETAAAPIAEKSIAVLPLSNEGGNAEEEYFSDGLSEDLITALSQFAGLKVISRNSSFQFRNSKDGSKAIGEKLGVAHLLEGSVRRAGDEVRINASLVRAADGSTAWSERYDRPYKDLFKLQDDITNAVATSLKARLLADEGAVVQSDRPPGGNLDAYTAYLQGKSHFDRQTSGDVRTAIERFDAAIAIDPDYAQAYASKAKAWTSVAAVFSGSADETHQAYVNARTAVNTALKLDANLAEAHLARGRLILWADFDWPGADAEYRRALQLAPNSATAKSSLSQVRATLGHLDEALDLVHQVLAVDALDADHYEWLSMYSAALGDLDEAERAARKQVALRPSIEYGYSQLSTVLVLRGDAAAALEAANGSPPGIWREMAVTLALQIGSDRAAADEALKALIEHQASNAAFQIAEIYATRKELDHAFEWLDRAWANRDPGVGQLLYDALLLPYKNDPRFAAFCKKVGLPAPGGESPTAAQTVADRSQPGG